MALAMMNMIKPPGRIEGGQVIVDGTDLMTLSKEAMLKAPYGSYVTDDKGYFEIPLIADMPLTLIISKSGYNTLYIPIQDVSEVGQQEITLEREKESFLFRIQKNLYSN